VRAEKTDNQSAREPKKPKSSLVSVGAESWEDSQSETDLRRSKTEPRSIKAKSSEVKVKSKK
jgi:hypothetical protein